MHQQPHLNSRNLPQNKPTRSSLSPKYFQRFCVNSEAVCQEEGSCFCMLNWSIMGQMKAREGRNVHSCSWVVDNRLIALVFKWLWLECLMEGTWGHCVFQCRGWRWQSTFLDSDSFPESFSMCAESQVIPGGSSTGDTGTLKRTRVHMGLWVPPWQVKALLSTAQRPGCQLVFTWKTHSSFRCHVQSNI